MQGAMCPGRQVEGRPVRRVVLHGGADHQDLLPAELSGGAAEGREHAVLPDGGRRAADFIALLQMIAEAFPLAPVIVVICHNDSIHHARKVTAYLDKHPRLELLYGARYSPHDNPAEMGLPQCELRRSPHPWLPGSLSVEVPSPVQRRRLW